MNTFDAIAQIRRQSLDRQDAMRFLIENLGFSSTYAEEIVEIIFADRKPAEHTPVAQAAGN